MRAQEYIQNDTLTYFTDGPDKGIIPLTCSELFVRVEEKTAADPNVSFTVEVSYIEVCHVINSVLSNSNMACFRFTMRKYEIC